MDIPDVALAAIASAVGVVLAKSVDIITSRSANTTTQMNAAYTRQRELDTMKDNLIIVFQKQIDELRKNIDELLEKNRLLYEENIKVKYEISTCQLTIDSLRRDLADTRKNAGLPPVDEKKGP